MYLLLTYADSTSLSRRQRPLVASVTVERDGVEQGGEGRGCYTEREWSCSWSANKATNQRTRTIYCAFLLCGPVLSHTPRVVSPSPPLPFFQGPRGGSQSQSHTQTLSSPRSHLPFLFPPPPPPPPLSLSLSSLSRSLSLSLSLSVSVSLQAVTRSTSGSTPPLPAPCTACTPAQQSTQWSEQVTQSGQSTISPWAEVPASFLA